MPGRARTVVASPTEVALGVARQVWPLLALLAVLTVAALAWWVRSGDAVPVTVSAQLLLVATAGLVGSFALHEVAHLVALRRIDTIDAITLERTAWRTSLVPHGPMGPHQIAMVAAAGPLACVAVGLALALVAPATDLAWWYLVHAVALVPPFGDGRALLTAARLRRRR